LPPINHLSHFDIRRAGYRSICWRTSHLQHCHRTITMQRTSPRTLLLTSITVVTLSITGCVADPEVTDNQPDGSSAPTHVEEITFPDTEVGQTSRWVLDEISGSNAINKQDWYPRVSPHLREDIPVDALVSTLYTELRPSMPYVPSD